MFGWKLEAIGPDDSKIAEYYVELDKYQAEIDAEHIEANGGVVTNFAFVMLTKSQEQKAFAKRNKK